MDQHERKKIVRAALGKMTFHQKPRQVTAMEQMAEKAFQMSNVIHAQVTPILQAGGWQDKPALKDTITRMHLDLIVHFSKEELENLATMLLTDIMMERIDSSPYGNDTPDLLSGK